MIARPKKLPVTLSEEAQEAPLAVRPRQHPQVSKTKVVDRGLCGVRNKGLSMKAHLQDKTRYCTGKNPGKGSE
jgi:hypothetical protein